MTPTVNKILAQSSTIIEYAILPIGRTAFRRSGSSQKQTLPSIQNEFRTKQMDMINILLLSSDALLSCSRPSMRKEKKPFSKDALEFLLPQVAHSQEEADTSQNSKEEEKEEETSDEKR